MNRKPKLLLTLMSLLVAVSAGLLASWYFDSRLVTAQEMSTYQQSIAEKVLRFHVLANSNSTEDQELKLIVKDAVVRYLTPLMAESESLLLTEEIIHEQSDKILEIAQKVISEQGYEYEVRAEIVDEYYPLKTYGDVMLPPGIYHSYTISIGSANGNNWWCILYPPLCFIDATSGVVPDSSKDQLESLLSEDEYLIVTTGAPRDITFKSKIIEIVKSLFD